MLNSSRQIFVDGAWVPSTSTDTIDVFDPATEQVIAKVPAGTGEDVDRAVAAARAAFPGWSAEEPRRRAELLRRVSDALVARREEFAEMTARDVGAPIAFSRQVQVGLGISCFSTAATLAEEYDWESEAAGAMIVREPIGVVAAITPWNFPLNQIAAKVAYALAAGCTVVLKPSEVAPLGAYALTDVIDEAGFPAGVFNLVSGLGAVVGTALASHPDVDMVSFTGSVPAGRRVSELAATTIKRVALELGGKSANLVLDGVVDLETAVRSAVGKCYLNAGQTCSALTRLLVPRDLLAVAGEIAAAEAERLKVGDPMDESTDLGPLASAVQRDRVAQYIRTGIDEGATLVTGGPDAPEGLTTGYFVRPTVFTDVDPAMTIAREEIFGPVLSIIGYTDEDDAVRIANDSPFGLSGGVWSGDRDRAVRVARRLRTGRVEINGDGFDRAAPFGGYKQSGNGREHGRFGFEEFLEVKAIAR